ncbi:WD repeat, SAM and U-box domain-containing protein 1 [Bagarius yarrelli]|uniref:WD repeat, SAM and U-box domain-containing protein 1 n=1 Tax=Bagarius yarrelli TaxID=175774 RepID=A0A556VBU3_BAGYA|nr:WD repeat, SAM and U-box domain-containing protein 1 [Bagarius yarrelli]
MVSLICTVHDHRDDVNCCAFSSSLLATCSADKTVRVYSTRDFSELPFSPLSGHGYGVHCCCFSACGQYLASCSTDATTVVWTMASGEIEAVLEHPGRSPVRVCTFSPDSSFLISGASDGTVALWDFPSRLLTGAVPDTTMVACSFSPCGQLFATGSTYGDLRIWNLSMNQLQTEKYAHDLGVTCCQFSPQMMTDTAGHVVQFRLVSCGQDSLLKIWIVFQNFSTGCKMQLLHTLSGQQSAVLCCAYSADGQLLVSGSMDKTVAVYEAVRDGVCVFSDRPSDSHRLYGQNSERVEDGGRLQLSGWGAEVPFSSDEAGRKWPGHSRLMVNDWSEDDVSAWLREEGLESLVDAFKANNIDGAELLSLSKESLSSDLHIESLGLRSKVLRKIEEMKMAPVSGGIPDEFLCPITHEVMKDPVIAADGYSYEREAIDSWIKTKNRSSPMTNLPLQTTLLTPNRTLKMAICRWSSSQ